MEQLNRVFRVGIIGAGISGLSLATALSSVKNVTTVIHEKSKVLSGRAATRRRDSECYDNGANYISFEDEKYESLFLKLVSGEESSLVTIPRKIWLFDKLGNIKEGDPRYSLKNKYTFKQGVNYLGKILRSKLTNVDFRFESKVTSIENDKDGGWYIIDENSKSDRYDLIVLTPPSPQIADILANSKLDAPELKGIEKTFRDANYFKIISTAIKTSVKIPRPVSENYFALLNVDREHPIGWLSFEEDKPGHVLDGTSLLIVQMSPKWSEENFEKELKGDIESQIVQITGDLLHFEFKEHIQWLDSKKWRFALPERGVERENFESYNKLGLFFAGDFIFGKGRVSNAFISGFQTADLIVGSLDSWAQHDSKR